MTYAGPEKRQYPRVCHSFLAYYSPIDRSNELDLTQVKNISAGGLLFTTSRPFAKGESLSLKIRLPGWGNPLLSIGRVIESYPVSQGAAQFYHTRLAFSSIDESDRQKMAEVLNNYP